MGRVQFDEAPIGGEGRAALAKWGQHLGWSQAPGALPHNALVVRPKPLVELASAAAVEGARVPAGDRDFAAACNTMDGLTGVYVYAPREDVARRARSYQCHQFPWSSGYPEDPTTSIAAATLAATLRCGPNDDKTPTIVNYDIYQGTAMGRSSLIQAVDLHRDERGEGLILFGLQGQVDTDATSIIRISKHLQE